MGSFDPIAYFVAKTSARFKQLASALATTYAWIKIAELGIARYGAGSFLYGSRIYAVGGFTRLGVTVSIEAEDVLTGERSYPASLPSGRAFYGYGFVNNKFYLIGGIDVGGIPRREIYEYNPATGTVTLKSATLPKGIAYCASAVYGGNIYISGGVDENGDITPSTFMYNPSADTVTTRANMNVARQNHALAVLGARLYAFGGDNGSAGLQSIEEYNPATNVWTTLALTLPRAVSGLRAAPLLVNSTQFILLAGG
jgi:N-acetylneuraminic acid mutarotase